MNRSNSWFFLAIGVAIGTVLYYSSSSDRETARIARLGRFQAVMEEGRVVYKPNSIPTMKNEVRENERLGGIAPTIEATTEKANPTSAGPTVAKNAKDAKADAKKALDKKKKKKKKKKSRTGQDVPAQDMYENSNDDDGETAATGGTSGSPGVGGRGAMVNNVDPNRMPETVEEWKAYLLGYADFERASRFVKLYQTMVVKEDVFYPVVVAMIEDPREEIVELGVMALGATPSVKSFSLLVSVQSEDGNSSKLLSQIDVYLRTYTRLEYLRHLVGALNLENDLESNFIALRILETAASQHLKGKSNQPTEQGQGGSTRAPASNVVRYFNQFVPTLTRLSESSPDGNFRANATDALRNLQGLLAPLQQVADLNAGHN